ncbi:hypothetical protein KJ853_02620 [Patescibacteria group bacterium]|nr:hypothetical protein [Patescibacteria group bacterium]
MNERRDDGKKKINDTFSSYLRVPEDNFILKREDIHPYCRVPRDFDEKKVTKKPSFFKKLYHTFF